MSYLDNYTCTKKKTLPKINLMCTCGSTNTALIELLGMFQVIAGEAPHF